MLNCPRCDKLFVNSCCKDCDIFYFKSHNNVDMRFILNEKDYYIIWFFSSNECILESHDGRIQFILPKMLPFDISIEQIEKYLLLL
jgi:hypothetical protein